MPQRCSVSLRERCRRSPGTRKHGDHQRGAWPFHCLDSTESLKNAMCCFHRASSRSRRARPSSVSRNARPGHATRHQPARKTSPDPRFCPGIAPWRNRWIVLTDTELNYYNSNAVRSLHPTSNPRKRTTGVRRDWGQRAFWTPVQTAGDSTVHRETRQCHLTSTLRRLGRRSEVVLLSATSRPSKSTPRNAHGGDTTLSVQPQL